MIEQYSDKHIAWLVQEVHVLLDTVKLHKAAINELGEREEKMSAEFDAANQKFDTYVANVSTAVTNFKTQVNDFQSQVTTLAAQVAELTAEVGKPNEDIANLVALAQKIQTATDALAEAVKAS